PFAGAVGPAALRFFASNIL
ncbi:hypothetical protein EVA_21440, partial [gut metagenome]